MGSNRQFTSLTWSTVGRMAWTYILECADGSFYVGSTVDLDGRVSQHNAGLGAAYTRRRGRLPVKLAWAADFDRVDEAFAFREDGAGLEPREAHRPDRGTMERPARPGQSRVAEPQRDLTCTARGFETVASATSPTTGRRAGQRPSLVEEGALAPVSKPRNPVLGSHHERGRLNRRRGRPVVAPGRRRSACRGRHRPARESGCAPPRRRRCGSGVRRPGRRPPGGAVRRR
jgi:predicted GIY-YIG superfamily endonuclease